MIFLTSFEQLTGLPEALAYFFFAVLGACIGSFLNVVIYRVPNEKSLFTPSRCPNCDAKIKPYHNLPVVGWLMLGGKCASCKEPIAWRYPAIEALTAVVFALVYWQIGLTVYLPGALAFAATMIALIFIDADHMILPNVITATVQTVNQGTGSRVDLHLADVNGIITYFRDCTH